MLIQRSFVTRLTLTITSAEHSQRQFCRRYCDHGMHSVYRRASRPLDLAQVHSTIRAHVLESMGKEGRRREDYALL